MIPKITISQQKNNYKSTLNYFGRINYTFQHRKAYRKVEKELTGRNSLKGYFHDLNKVVMYVLGLPTKKAHNIHQKLSPHHVKNGKVKDAVSAIIDWECARLTKPDKSLSAFKYYKKTWPDGIPKIEEALKKLGLWKK